MDLSFLQSIHGTILYCMNISFNPCSYGSFVLTRIWLWYNAKINHRVSILVLMDLSFLQKAEKQIEELQARFNPCSYGSSVLTMSLYKKMHAVMVEFQSLFLWIFRSYMQKRLIWLLYGNRFNPCSYGSFVLT